MKKRKPAKMSAGMRRRLELQVWEYIAYHRPDLKGCVIKISPTGRMAAVRLPSKHERR